MTPRLGAAACLALAVVLAAPAAEADRLHLSRGGTIDVDRWWVDGDWIYYESQGGTLGLPRASVDRIEANASPPEPPRRDELPDARIEQQRLRDPDLERRLVKKTDKAEAAFAAGRYDEASEIFDSVLDREPRAYRARVGFAAAEMALQRDGTALAAVLDGLALHPKGADLWELLGNLRDREERVPDALDAWRRAAAIRPSDRLKEKIQKAERELQAGRKLDFARSSHFNVRYDGEVDAALARDVLDHLEEQYWEISQAVDHAPDRPITLLLYPKKQFKDVTQSADWVGGVFDGKIRVPLGGLSMLTDRARAVLSHELTHAIVHSKTRGQCPWWLQEGLAQWMEGKRVKASERRALVERTPRLGLSGDDPDDVRFEYTGALALTEYLIDLRGAFGIAWLLELLGEGAEPGAALEEVYGQGQARLIEDQRAWLSGARR